MAKYLNEWLSVDDVDKIYDDFSRDITTTQRNNRILRILSSRELKLLAFAYFYKRGREDERAAKDFVP